MPPLSTWYTPRETIATWARGYAPLGSVALAGGATRAVHSPALAFYAWRNGGA